MNQNPTFPRTGAEGCRIVRLSPQEQGFAAEYRLDVPADSLRLEYRPAGSPGQAAEIRQSPAGDSGEFRVFPVFSHLDYQLRLRAFFHGTETACSGWRLVRCGPVPGKAVNYIHPEDYTYDSSGRSPASPSIARLEGGALVASHDVFWQGGGQNLTFVFRSDDGGESWRFLSELSPCFWGKLFSHRGKLYMLGTSTEYGALSLFCSSDEGKSWSAPSILLPAGDSETGGPHKAPVPVVEHRGRLWTGIDYGCWKAGGHASGAISAPAGSDLMDPSSWTCTGFVRQDGSWAGAPAGRARGTLEGSVAAGRDGNLYSILRYQHDSCVPAYGKAVLLRLDAGHPDRAPDFCRFIDFPGSLSKFAVRFDPRTGLYYALVNRVTGPNLRQRNILSLTASPDLIRWELRRDILNYEDCGCPEGAEKTAFQYPDFLFDGDDILCVCRTALHNAWNYHNANHLTFHRIRNYAL